MDMNKQVVAEISVVPIGVGDKGLSSFVASCLDIVKDAEGLSYQLTPMSTIIEGPIDEVFKVARKMHECPFTKGAPRVLTTLKIDHHRDKALTMTGKVKSVKKLHTLRKTVKRP
jgi:uncharacterized protein (TIGR00106 family)